MSSPWTAEELIDGGKNQTIALRVHDVSSLTVLDGNELRASDPRFVDGCSNRDWRAEYNLMQRRKAWRKTPETIDSVTDHVTGGWDQHSLYGNDRPSPWISATADFTWAVWEISRRLTVKKCSEVDLIILRRIDWYSFRYQGNRQVTLDAHAAIRKYLESIGKGSNPLQQKAINFSKASSEVLFYGKLWSKDVLETMSWGRHQKPPLKLPREFSVSPRRNRPGDWIDQLVWDPYNDSFSTAVAKVALKRKQMGLSTQGKRSSRQDDNVLVGQLNGLQLNGDDSDDDSIIDGLDRMGIH